MTARPVDPDRTDAVARVLGGDDFDYPWMSPIAAEAARLVPRRQADAILTTDDPAAVAAILAEYWQRHPQAVLDAGVNAGVLREVIAVRCAHGFPTASSAHTCTLPDIRERRLVTEWAEWAEVTE